MTTPQPQVTSQEIDAAVDRAVRKVFAILGVNIDNPESVEQFREDLRFGRKLRRASDKGWVAVVGLVAVGLALATWEGIKRIIVGGN